MKMNANEEACPVGEDGVVGQVCLAGLPGLKGGTIKRIYESEIKNIIGSAKIESRKVGDNTTVVTVTLANGWTMTEQSACIDPSAYNHDLGVKICMEHIEDKLWMLEGYRRVCEIAEEGEDGGN